jgi:signal transduction histidine kinase/ActR/RegA family two-component response regulator
MTKEKSDHAGVTMLYFTNPNTLSPKATSSGLPFWLAAGVLLVNLVVFTLAGLSLHNSRDRYRERAEVTTRNMSLALAEYTDDLLSKVDVALIAVSEEYQRQLAAGGINDQLLNAYLNKFNKQLTFLDSMRVADADGFITYGVNVVRSNRLSIVDRDYFVRLRDDVNTGFVISKPIFGLISHKWVVAFARRINTAEGSFAGVAYGSLIIDDYSKILASFDVGQHGVIAMRDIEMHLIARHPDLTQGGFDLGSKSVSPEQQDILKRGMISGTYTTAQTNDGIPRTLSFRKIGDYPWFVFVGLACDEYLAPWRSEVIRTIAFVIAFMLVTFSLFRLLTHHWNRQIASAAALFESEKKFRALYESMNEGVAIHEIIYDETAKAVDYRILDVNPCFEQILGIERSQAIGALASRLYTVDDPPYLDWYAAVAQTGEPTQFETYFPPLDKYFSISAFSPGLDRFVTVFTDISERKRIQDQLMQTNRDLEESIAKAEGLAEQATSANKAKSEFLANMSHEIRTPLNGVLGMLQLLETTALTDEQKEYLLAAVKSSKRLTRLLSDILDLSRIEAGKLTIQEAEFDVEEIRRAIVDVFQPVASNKNLNLDFTIYEHIPRLLIGDESRLLQILFNVVGNAIKFTDKGHVRIEASSLKASDENSFRVLFTVEDTGVGIPDERINDVFDAFVQIEGSYTRSFQGAGLGLAIVKKLMRMMGGELAIDSEEGAGTTVYLSLPFRLPTSHRKTTGQEAPVERVSSKSKRRILFVDDDKVSLITGKRLLEKSGYDVATASNGMEAVRMFYEQDFDLILMDVQMPIMDGVEATKRIRASGSSRADIPIIAITAYAMVGDKEKFLSAGMNDYIAKPVSMDAMMDAIQRASARPRSSE